jgi:2-amino-4-hydroxy-6-hydroxymethyldihydropteridine diphosphokinase
MSHTIYLALGSNICRQVALTHAMLQLSKIMNNISCSLVYESVPLHAKGPNFYNAVIKGTTDLELDDFLSRTKEIECSLGCMQWIDNESKVQNIRCLDIDILLFDDIVSDTPQLPREDVFKYDFVVFPLVELEEELMIQNKLIKDIAENFKNSNLTVCKNVNLQEIILNKSKN